MQLTESRAIPSQPEQQVEEEFRPPGSRRAASTGGIGLSSTTARDHNQRSNSPSDRAWEPGMPLPPPPPGPPPTGIRSQSMNRTLDNVGQHSSSRVASSNGSGVVVAAPVPRRPAQQGTRLGPIPPTPAGWSDDGGRHTSQSPMAANLSLDAENTRNVQVESDVSRASTLSRYEAGQRGIRERRNEVRATREHVQDVQSAIEPRSNPWSRNARAGAPTPPDLVLNSNQGSISRRRAVRRSPLQDRKFYPPHSPEDGTMAQAVQPAQEAANEHMKGIGRSGQEQMAAICATTPPFSPASDKMKGSIMDSQASCVSQKALPTPPTLRSGEDFVAPVSLGLTIPASSFDRPVSHILHAPNEDMRVQPLSPARTPLDVSSSTRTPQPCDNEAFALASIERHRKFIELESRVTDDREKLELFSAFIIKESRLRRDRYASAFDSMAGEIFDLTRDLWRPYNNGTRSTTPTAPNDARRDEQHQALKSASTADSPDGFTPRSEAGSPSSVGGQARPREGQTRSGYQPVLSPIPSMAMSVVPDDQDSRGRSASRWWEASTNGSAGQGHRIERSRRESKYMGVPPDVRENLRYDASSASQASTGNAGPSETSLAIYGPNEYPPEKTGWHDQLQSQLTPVLHVLNHCVSAPNTPDPYKLDVSRLVTLPPPYPRHHPAVNNNHPELASIRANLRSLSERDRSEEPRRQHREKVSSASHRERESAGQRRKYLLSHIQDRVREGAMSFAQAAKAEADFEDSEIRRGAERTQADFKAFEKDVYIPLHASFSENILKASSSIDQLRSSLFKDAQSSDPTTTQVGGDEQPELLEKLTLLKWFFEAREQLHNELFLLEGERSDHYKDVVVVPYRLAGNEEKAEEAERFFLRDGKDRKLNFQKESVKRFEDFLHVIEENVTRGVEDQLSAFWDIAPGLLAVVQKVPHSLANLDILIPQQEYEENPSYYDFPTQYLYSLLAHAEKSAYQFIESQTNLLCLLHEVKSCVMFAGCRLLGMQRQLAGEDYGGVNSEMEAVRMHEEKRLTDDLKEKVALVDGQWGEALGKGLGLCKRRVEVFLVEHGGWDDNLQE